MARAMKKPIAAPKNTYRHANSICERTGDRWNTDLQSELAEETLAPRGVLGRAGLVIGGGWSTGDDLLNQAEKDRHDNGCLKCLSEDDEEDRDRKDVLGH
jgi:hypothetical protein